MNRTQSIALALVGAATLLTHGALGQDRPMRSVNKPAAPEPRGRALRPNPLDGFLPGALKPKAALATMPTPEAPPTTTPGESPIRLLEDSRAPAPPAAASAPTHSLPGDEPPSDEAIDRSLVGYGEWSEDPTYGKVWVPSPNCVGENFAPYATGGHWSLDGDRWRWNSTLPWGEPTFHYGNWIWRDGNGWAWVPGKTFAPAWVVWRLGEPGQDVVGWAPMPPPAPGGAAAPAASSLPFRFVPTRQLFSKELERHLVSDASLGKRLLETTRVFQAVADTASGPLSPTLSDARIRAVRFVRTRPSDASTLMVATSPSGGAETATTAPESAPTNTRETAPRYRCTQVTEQPRIWRCGYE